MEAARNDGLGFRCVILVQRFSLSQRGVELLVANFGLYIYKAQVGLGHIFTDSRETYLCWVYLWLLLPLCPQGREEVHTTGS